MEITVKTTKLTKSKILQMEYIHLPRRSDIDVLGWVNIDKKRYVIVKTGAGYYRADYPVEIQSELTIVQFPKEGGGWEYPELHKVSCKTWNGGRHVFTTHRDDAKNLELEGHLRSYMAGVKSAGQIFW